MLGKAGEVRLTSPFEVTVRGYRRLLVGPATAPSYASGRPSRSPGEGGLTRSQIGTGALPEMPRQGHQDDAEGSDEANAPEELKGVPDVV